jgi:hypothetical protein
MSPVKYERGFYIPEDDILHSHSRENFKFYTESRLFKDAAKCEHCRHKQVLFAFCTEGTEHRAITHFYN